MNATTNFSNPVSKSVFINQLDGGYTLNLQGNQFYPTKVCVTIDDVKTAITDFFNTPEPVNTPIMSTTATTAF